MTRQLHRMGALRTRVIDIAALQELTSADFRGLDVPFNVSGASPNASVKSLIGKARDALAEQPPWNCCGVYGWIDLHSQTEPLIYVGIAAFDETGRRRGQRIGSRLSDYLTKEYSLLDASLQALNEEEAEARIHARLSRLHNPAKVGQYVHNHMKSYRMANATHVLYSDASDFSRFLRGVETALIISGQRAQPDRPLVNTQQTRVKPSALDSDTWQWAELVVRSWAVAGLPQEFARKWCSAIFHGAAE